MPTGPQHTDKSEYIELYRPRKLGTWIDRVSSADFHAGEVAKRLRQALDHAGGNKAVMVKTGIPSGTLQEHLSGRAMKTETAVIVADACGISLEWLIAGRGPMVAGQPEAIETPQNSAVSPPPTPFASIDVDQLAAAMQAAAAAFKARGKAPTMRQLAQVTLLLYDDEEAAIDPG
jgi:hypothetical protein